MNSIESLVPVLKEHTSFILLSHTDPDGDTLGSQLALAFLLEELGKKVILYNQSPVPLMYHFLPGRQNILSHLPQHLNLQEWVVIALDAANLEQLGEKASLFQGVKLFVNIDHHISNTKFGHLNVLDPQASAVGEMIFDLYQALEVPVGYEAALSLYTAILTDTGSFRYSNTAAKTHLVISQLIRLGVKPHLVAEEVYETRTLQATKLHQLALGTLKVTSDGKIAYMKVTNKMLDRSGAKREDAKDLVNYACALGQVQVAILFKEAQDGKVKVSLRSKGDIDVNKIASLYGGGGHSKAAGCLLSTDIPKAKRIILKTVKAALSNGWDPSC